MDFNSALLKKKRRLEIALEKGRTKKWCLTLWSRYIRARDNERCLICNSNSDVAAHHIFRKTTFAVGMFELGNGICLCHSCHAQAHSEYNGRADHTQPLGFRGGDDQDEAAFLYGALCDDACKRGLSENDFYFISDTMLRIFVNFQGYEEYFVAMKHGKISRVRLAHEIWRGMPEEFYVRLVESLLCEEV